MRVPPNYGPRYTESFEQAFAELASRKKLALVPFLLESVALDPGLMQADGLHPTAGAQPRCSRPCGRHSRSAPEALRPLHFRAAASAIASPPALGLNSHTREDRT